MPPAEAAILVGLGSNLPTASGMKPVNILQSALGYLNTNDGIQLVQCSSIYCTAPIPPSAQPFYVNAVAEISADVNAVTLLAILLTIEQAFDRERIHRNAARTLDLDLLAYGRAIRYRAPILPHPHVKERDFVLAPLAEIRPDWPHPVTGHSALNLLSLCPSMSIRQKICLEGFPSVRR